MSLSAFPLMGFLQARLRGSRTICSEYETRKAQYAYRCVVLSDSDKGQKSPFSFGLNAPTGAWCSLTLSQMSDDFEGVESQCTYRCVVLPDPKGCYRERLHQRLNAPTGAWCSLTRPRIVHARVVFLSQCTYRCVVLPDFAQR